MVYMSLSRRALTLSRQRSSNEEKVVPVQERCMRIETLYPADDERCSESRKWSAVGHRVPVTLTLDESEQTASSV